MAFKCLIADEMHDSITTLLDEINVEWEYKPEITREEIKKALPDFDGLIIRSKTNVDADLIDGSDLKFIARAGAGIDNLDEETLVTRGIKILNAPEGNRDAVGEHVTGLILNLLNNIQESHNQVLENKWLREENRGYELASMTVGIIGYGNSGSSLAEKLTGFGCKVIAYDKYVDSISDQNARLVDLEEILEKADILSLHIPLTGETKKWINLEFFKRFKKNIIFINSSRGEISPVADILKAIKIGKVTKAGLDVLEWEKFNHLDASQQQLIEELKNTGKVIFTPHIAGWTFESYKRINEVLVKKISKFLDEYNYLK